MNIFALSNLNFSNKSHPESLVLFTTIDKKSRISQNIHYETLIINTQTAANSCENSPLFPLSIAPPFWNLGLGTATASSTFQCTCTGDRPANCTGNRKRSRRIAIRERKHKSTIVFPRIGHVVKDYDYGGISREPLGNIYFLRAYETPAKNCRSEERISRSSSAM